jgi:HK97 family phage major capsid protein/HK97 family phage prohead protease
MKTNRIPCNRIVEFRAADSASEDDGFTLEGYAAVFDTVTRIRSWEGEFDEKIARGAFKKTLKDRTSPVIMQYDHGRDVRVGSVPIGSYTDLREDNVGLPVSGRLFDNDTVLPVRQAIAAGAITGMSFKFEVLRDEWRDNKGKLIKPDELEDLLWSPGTRGPIVRTVKEIKLYEAGPVSSPAYPTTSVGVRMGTLDADERGASPLTREEVIESYKRSMYIAEESEEERIEEWLEAEKEYRALQDDIELLAWLTAEDQYRWLKAETEYRADVQKWLDAETANIKARSDAAPKGTSRTPNPIKRSAARKSTPRRESTIPPKKKDRVMTLEELRALIAEMTERQSDIEAEHRDAELPEDVQAEFDEASEAIERATKTIASIEARQERVRKAAEEGKSEKPGAPHVRKNLDNIYSLEEIRKEAFDGNDFVKRAGEAAKHVLERSSLPQNADEKSRDSILEMLNDGVDDGAVAKRLVATGNPAYERAIGRAIRAGSLDVLTLTERQIVDETRAAINIGSDAASGFAVPFQLDPTLVHLGAGYINPLRQLAKIIQLYGKDYRTLTISEIQVYRALEAEIATETAPTLAQAIVKANKVHGWVPFSMEADEDWAGMRSEIFQLLQEAKDKEEANSFLLGTGVAPYPEGLITGATSTVDTAANGGAFTLADIYALMEALPVEFESNASFLATKQIYNKIRGLGNTANANQLWGSPDLSNGNSAKLLETPTYRVTGMDSTTAAGKKFLVYGDIRKAFTILDRIGMEIELVPMLFAFAAGAAYPAQGTVTQPRPTGQRGFYAHWRNNSKVVNPDAVRVLKGKA